MVSTKGKESDSVSSTWHCGPASRDFFRFTLPNAMHFFELFVAFFFIYLQFVSDKLEKLSQALHFHITTVF